MCFWSVPLIGAMPSPKSRCPNFVEAGPLLPKRLWGIELNVKYFDHVLPSLRSASAPTSVCLMLRISAVKINKRQRQIRTEA